MNKALKKTISIVAYIWAIICIIVVFIIFFGGYTLAKLSTRLPFMKVDPIYTGGEVVKTYPSDSLLIKIHEPVFSALIGESKEGFVQVEFFPADSVSAVEDKPVSSSLPRQITEKIDYNLDGAIDFILIIDTQTGTTDLKSCPSKRMSVSKSTKVQNYWLVRVGLPNPRMAATCATCEGCPSQQK